MKILFSQTKTTGNEIVSVLGNFGVSQCYLKYLVFGSDYKNTTLKVHHHTNFEIHMIIKGSQTYEVCGKSIKINKGQFLLLPPLVKHKVVITKPDTEKISLTFEAIKGKIMDLSVKNISDFVLGQTPSDAEADILYIMSEHKAKKKYFRQLVCGRVFECIIHILRVAGMEDVLFFQEANEEDARFLIADQYIKDNIEKNISVQDIAIYCNLSAKQITRIFKEKENVGVAQYIRNEKCNYIKKLLQDKKFTLKEISEKMHFNNEYYFNAFVKKNLGMAPGEYRKTVNKE